MITLLGVFDLKIAEPATITFAPAEIASGAFSTEKSVKEGKAYLVIVAGDASDNTKKHFRDMTTFYEVPMFIYGTKEELGHAMGKELRASLAITDPGFAKSLTKLLNE